MAPAIVVVAYNRPRSLQRLLNSLKAAHYDGYTDIELIISVDRSQNVRVQRCAEQFQWEHGTKRLIVHQKRQGLRKHILKCGDLTEDFGSIIVLEDDLIVSPFFYQYATQAEQFYGDDPKIAGVSLYSMRYNETARRPFEPIAEEHDVFFIQLPSSSGQMWTKQQWTQFRTWYDDKQWVGADSTCVPANISDWPESSWKKYFAIYLINRHKYFVYPRKSLTTNFGEIGTHSTTQNHIWQVPLLMSHQTFYFADLQQSQARYDAFIELEPASFKKTNTRLASYEFQVDLYGTKPLELLQNTPHALSSRPCPNSMMGFQRALRPHEMGVLLNQPGTDIYLGEPGSYNRASAAPKLMAHLHYDMPLINFYINSMTKREKLSWLAGRVTRKLKRIF